MLDIESISFKYGTIKVLEDVTFTADRGECIGIIGPNGSGKSTLLKTLSKVLKPAAGKVVVCGKDLERYSVKELARQMAVVPQDTSIEFDFTCLEVVLMGRNPHMGRFELEGRKDLDIAKEAMTLTNTWHLRERPLSEISGGERQRVIIARALAQEPAVLLLDEPVSHLDINHQIEILTLVERLKARSGLVVIVILHDLNLAARYCDRLVLLCQNKILATGRPDEVLTQEHIRQAFHANVLIRKHPLTGYLYVTLLNSLDSAGPANGRTVHLVCGAGTGTQLMFMLRSRGYEVTAGVLNVLDSDYDTAIHLNIKTASEAPFSPITPESCGQAVEMMRKADAIVISDVPFGWGNLKNLEAVLEVSGAVPILLVEKGQEERDFTGGEASALLARIKASGAVTVKNIEEAIESLARPR
jgi:iron complex transport system ATP-binding protein